MAESKFDKLSKKLALQQRISKKEADAEAAAIGRKKYGKKRFAAMGALARKKHRG